MALSASAAEAPFYLALLADAVEFVVHLLHVDVSLSRVCVSRTRP